MKKTAVVTMTQAKACRIKGNCHDKFELIELVPKVTAAAGIDPPNQPQL
jgi:hypothetical protein